MTGHLENREKSLKFKYDLSVEAAERERMGEAGRGATQVEGPCLQNEQHGPRQGDWNTGPTSWLRGLVFILRETEADEQFYRE